MSALPHVVNGRHFGQAYSVLLGSILRHGAVERNERTGKEIKVYPWGPTSFTIDLSDGYLPTAGNRRLFPGTAAAETAWYLMGTQDAEFMLKHAKVVWEKFVEYDPPGGSLVKPRRIVRAAYGHRWRRHFKRDQLCLAVEALRKNPSDRRIWISAWDPASDGLGAPHQLNVPCPVGFTLSITDGRLSSSYLLRSSDVFVGLPYDVMGHAILMDLIAAELGVGLGFMHFTLAHPHVYDVHWEMAGESLRGGSVPSDVKLVNRGDHSRYWGPDDFWRPDPVTADPELFVETYKVLGKQASWPEYSCKPEVVQ